MSDPPPGEHPPVNSPIPGLSEQLSVLSEIASRAGYRLTSVVFTPSTTTVSSPLPPLPPPSVIFSNPMPATILQPPATTYLTSPPSLTAPVHDPPKLPTRPLSAPSTDLPLLSQPAPKRPSPSHPEPSPISPQHSPSQPKRPRVSSPENVPSKRSTAFWGTVLEQRSAVSPTFEPPTELQAPRLFSTQAPYHLRPSQPPSPTYLQRLQRPLVGPSLSNLPATVPEEEIRPLHQPQPQPYAHLSPREESTGIVPTRIRELDFEALKRTPTLPHVPRRSVRSPETSSPPSQPLPGLQRSFSARHPTISGLLHRTGTFLSRVSPFPSASLPAQSLQQPAVAAPPVFPTPGRNLEMLEQRDPQLHGFELIQRHGIPPIRSPSQSHSASASIVSQARPASIPTSPKTPSSRIIERGGVLPTASIDAPTTMMANPSQLPSGRGRRPSTQQAAPGSQQFSCPLCDAKFGRKSDKTRHVRVVHDKSRPFVCAICGKTFGEKSNMLKHRASVHDDVRIFRCPYCDMSFSQRAMCDNHVRTIHDKKQAKYFCEQCGRPFSRKVLLHEHYAQAHPQLLQAYRQYEAASADAEAAEAKIPARAVVTMPAAAAAASSSGASAGRSGIQSGGEGQYPGQAGDDFNEDEIMPVLRTEQRQRPKISGYGQHSRGQLDDTDDVKEGSGAAAPRQSHQVYGLPATESLLQQGLPSIGLAEGMDLRKQQGIGRKGSESALARYEQTQEEVERTQRIDDPGVQSRVMGSTGEAIQRIERAAHHAEQYAQQQAYEPGVATQQAQPQQSQLRIQTQQRREPADQSDSEDNSGLSVGKRLV